RSLAAPTRSTPERLFAPRARRPRRCSRTGCSSEPQHRSEQGREGDRTAGGRIAVAAHSQVLLAGEAAIAARFAGVCRAAVLWAPIAARLAGVCPAAVGFAAVGRPRI